MKHELIKTKHYLLVLSDDVPNDGDKCLANGKTYDNEIVTYAKSPIPSPFVSNLLILKKIIAHLPLSPLSDFTYLDGVDVLPKLLEEVDNLVEEEYFKFDQETRVVHRRQLQESLASMFNKAKETYKYTEKDLRMAIGCGMGVELGKEEEQINNFIQSLNQPKLPISFEGEPKYLDIDEIRERGKGFMNGNSIIQKTITNSQGRTEWVGKYLF
jgi:hypothetical protein